MLLPPFIQLKFRIWQRTGFDPQIKIPRIKIPPGSLAKHTKRLLARWDVIGMMAAAGALGWYGSNAAASAMSILLPVALLAVALIAVGFYELVRSPDTGNKSSSPR